MTIGVYVDPLRIFTSSMPQRGLLIELLQLRNNDRFVFFVTRRFENDQVLQEFFKQIQHFGNWELVVLKLPVKFMRIMQLLGFAYPRLGRKCDIYFSPDIETFGHNCRPVINYLADLSVFDDKQNTSLSKFNTFFRARCIKFMDSRSDCVVLISEFSASRYRFHFPHSAGKLKVIYNGINPLWFSQPVKPFFEDAAPYWIWMGGSYTSRKNLDRLFQAYRMVKDKYRGKAPDIILAGLDQDSIIKLKEVLKQQSLSDFVKLYPKMSTTELISMVDGSEGILFPSNYEGFGLPVVEAFARGKPGLVAAVTSLPEVSRGLAVLCNPADVDSIGKGLVDLMAQIGHDSGAADRRMQASRFTYERAGLSFSKLIEQLTTN